MLHVNHLIFNFLLFPILYPLLIVTSLFCPYPFQCVIRSTRLGVVVFFRFRHAFDLGGPRFGVWNVTLYSGALSRQGVMD